ncbi:PucR family transcriptional regulator [Arthrobacter sp. A5]|uniref:PucR family transcriptional regulator n=1 Tax=Arthrobacter sp. A5 TaxID=576926 RepID=UPI003DA7CF0E
MSLSLRELLQIPQISTDLLAGAEGLDQPVVWAHACEMPDPWDWLGPQELLLTIGYCVPRRAEQQAMFIRTLAQAGVAGMVVHGEPPMPRITQAMLKAADELSFPVLRSGNATPYSVIARAVASANQHEQLHRLGRLSRLSTVLSDPANTSRNLPLGRIADELGHRVYVLDATSGTPIFPTPEPVDPRVSAAIVAQATPDVKRLPGRLHIDLEEQSVTCFPVPSSRRAALLVVFDNEAHRMDPFAVLHVVNLIAIEIERLSVAYDIRRQRSSDLMRQLIDGRLDSESATQQLKEYGLFRDGLVAAALPEGYLAPDHLLMDQDFPYLMTEDNGHEIILLRRQDIPTLVDLLSPSLAIGTSDVIHAITHINDGVRAAKWALESASSQGGGHVDYASTHPPFLPRTVTEALDLVRTVLGTILDYDSEHETKLVHSLEVYLSCDRSWKQAATVLNIHKQTLGYRLNKIESLSGRRLASTADIAELWLAVLALRVIGEEKNP